MDKVMKTMEQLTSKPGEMKPSQMDKVDDTKKDDAANVERKVKEPVTASELKSIMDRVLRPTENAQVLPSIQAATNTDGQKATADDDKVDKMFSEVRKDVNDLKLLKYDLVVMKGAFKLLKINEPTRTYTPIVSSSVHPNRYLGALTGLPTSVNGSRSASTRSMPSRSVPSRSKLGRPFPPFPRKGRTRTRPRTAATTPKAKRNINFGLEPMSDNQLLRLHTDLKDLCKMHDIKYKDKPQANPGETFVECPRAWYDKTKNFFLELNTMNS
ncbi:hypothetical protein CBR_g8072 [Chara braunii]|uniref:Uncharacterized protein n=1 Tax=Chara braunii TaxID=69332 RepID=A0A388KL47_CHABU|nr:hypothetical protein CBR_g8072 [Chara braunii]|eukprot:GBG70774.1 hypothetical protein CBR_g8072 [Chara braunii]